MGAKDRRRKKRKNNKNTETKGLKPEEERARLEEEPKLEASGSQGNPARHQREEHLASAFGPTQLPTPPRAVAKQPNRQRNSSPTPAGQTARPTDARVGDSSPRTWAHVAAAAKSLPPPEDVQRQALQEEIIAATATLSWIQIFCLGCMAPAQSNSSKLDRSLRILTLFSKLLRRCPGEVIAVSALISVEEIKIDVSQDWMPDSMHMSANHGETCIS